MRLLLRDLLVHSDKRCLSLALALLIIGASLPAYAAGERPDINAGTINDSVKDHKTVIPPSANVKIEVQPGQEETPASKEGYKIKVGDFRITGQTIFPADKLQDLVKDAANQELTFSELENVAWRITKYFQDQGYMVAKAYIPSQDVNNGIVEIAVVPGRYGRLDIRNHSRLDNRAARRFLGRLKSGDYVKKDVLERTLLLMSDTGGISIKAALAPGKTAGTTDLIVEINNTNILTSQFSLDDYGNRYAGRQRRNLDLNFNNLGRTGDLLNLGGNNAGNTGGSTNNLYINYSLPVSDRGAKLGVGYYRMHYTLGEQRFSALDFNGLSKTTSIFSTYPLLRSRNRNLYVQFNYDHRQLEDHTYGFTYADKQANVWTVGLYGDSRDNFHGGGANSFALNISTGHLSFDGGRDANGNSALTVDRETARTAGTYTKVGLNFNRLQYLNNRTNFYFNFTGQLASKNLDSSEKLYLGGANGVRAYPQGDAAGDQGYLLTGELRWTMGPVCQLAAFIDNGRVTVNKETWPGAGGNSSTRTGAGLGLIFNSHKDYTVRLDYAWKIGSRAATADSDKSGRWWLRGVQYF